MNIIVNVDKNWAIGKGGALLFPIDADLKNFKRLTLNKIVVMGRKTLESLPGGKPLKDRRNIVLSKTLPETEGLHVCRSLASYAACRAISASRKTLSSLPVCRGRPEGR